MDSLLEFGGNFSNILAKTLTLGSCCFWEVVASALVVSCSSLFLCFLLFGEMLAHIFLLLRLLVSGFLFLINLGFLIAAWWGWGVALEVEFFNFVSRYFLLGVRAGGGGGLDDISGVNFGFRVTLFLIFLLVDVLSPSSTDFIRVNFPLTLVNSSQLFSFLGWLVVGQGGQGGLLGGVVAGLSVVGCMPVGVLGVRFRNFNLKIGGLTYLATGHFLVWHCNVLARSGCWMDGCSGCCSSLWGLLGSIMAGLAILGGSISCTLSMGVVISLLDWLGSLLLLGEGDKA